MLRVDGSFRPLSVFITVILVTGCMRCTHYSMFDLTRIHDVHDDDMHEKKKSKIIIVLLWYKKLYKTDYVKFTAI